MAASGRAARRSATRGEIARRRRSLDPRLTFRPESEEAVIGGVLLHPAKFAVVAPLIGAIDFAHPGCRALFQGFLDAKEADRPLDSITVIDELKRSDTFSQLNAFGGADYLVELAAKVVTVENIEYHARAVHAAARRRRFVATLSGLVESCHTDDDLDELVARAARSIEDARTTPALPTWRTPAERARTLGGQGQRLATGVPTFDEATRGGPRTGKVIVFGGAPGAGKTTWALQLAWAWAKRGIHVLVLAADEDADGLLIRVGQLEGFRREDLEEGNEYARAALAARLAEYPNFELVDADEDGATVEDASQQLAARARGAPSVLVVDSIQTVRAAGSDEADTPRARVDAVVAALKRAGKVDKHLVLATCELARGAYRSQNASERIDDLAAFKESGGIEYGVATAIVLRSVPIESGEGLVDVTMPKNRQGTKKRLRLVLDSRRAAFSEVALPDDEAASGPSPLEQVKLRVLEVLKKTVQPIESRGELARRTKKTRKTALAAIRELLEDGRIEVINRQFRIAGGQPHTP